jgi:cell wall-associated NlpC family hydrolase
VNGVHRRSVRVGRVAVGVAPVRRDPGPTVQRSHVRHSFDNARAVSRSGRVVVTCRQVTSADHRRIARRATPAAHLQPGDLIFHDSPVSHVSVYVGDGQMVTARWCTPRPPQPVEVLSVDSMGGIVAMRRIA